MDVRVYEGLFQFNQGMDQAVGSLDLIEKLELSSPKGISGVRTNLSELRCYANDHFASEIAQKEQEEENNFYRARRNREKAENGPNEVCFEMKSREAVRHEQGLPPRVVILPRIQADDERILASRRPRPARYRHNQNRLGP